MQQRKKSQLGAIMVEVIAALALIGIMGSVLYRQIQRRNEEIDNINIASEVRIVKEATTAYIQANRPYLELVVCPSSEPYVKAASNNAIDAYMPINWACDEGMENCLIDEFDIWFACDTMGSSGSERKMIWGLIVPRPESLPLKYDLRRAARIANLIGADGGVSDGIESGGNLTLYGTQGAWENLCGTDTYSPCNGRGVMHVAVTGMDVYVPEVETASIAANKVTVPNSLALDFLHSSSYFSVGNNDRNCIDNLVAGEYAHETIEDNKAVSDIILPPGATKGIGSTDPCAPLFWVGTPESSSGDTSDSSQVYVKNSLFVGRDNDTDSQALALRGGSDDEERGITVYDADGKSRIMLDAAEGRILGRIYDENGKGYKLNAETGEITLFKEYDAPMGLGGAKIQLPMLVLTADGKIKTGFKAKYYEGSSSTPTDGSYQIDPAGTSIMDDIRLTSRGGAKLSEILPDYVLKEIETFKQTSGSASQIKKPECPKGYAQAITVIPISHHAQEITAATLVGTDITTTQRDPITITITGSGSDAWDVTMKYGTDNPDDDYPISALAQTYCVYAEEALSPLSETDPPGYRREASDAALKSLTCTKDTDCDPLYAKCIDHRCVPYGTCANADGTYLGDHLYCYDGIQVFIQCTVDGDCGAGNRCINYACVPEASGS